MNLSKTYNPVVSPFKGVIFDLDGTLLNTLRCIGSAFNQALKTFNYPEHRFEDYAAFIGDESLNVPNERYPVMQGHSLSSTHW